MVTMQRGVLAIVLILSLMGCASLNYRPPVQSSDSVSAQKSYIYGRFSLDKDFMNQLRLAIRIENKNNSQIMSLRLLDEPKVYSVELEPGVYQLQNFIYAPLGALMEYEVKKINIPNKPSYLKKPFTVEAGKAYYLGDFFGSSRRTGLVVTPVFVSVSFRGGILNIQQNFTTTTNELINILPNLKSIELKPAWDEMVSETSNK